MKYANQTEFFLSEDCIPRHVQERARKRKDTLQRELDFLMHIIKKWKEQSEFLLKEAEILSKMRKLELEICKLKYFDKDDCLNPTAAKNSLKEIEKKTNRIETNIFTFSVLSRAIARAENRIKEINKELLELCDYILD